MGDAGGRAIDRAGREGAAAVDGARGRWPAGRRALGLAAAATVTALAVVAPSATGAVAAAPGVLAAQPDAALTKQRLYQLTLSRTYGRPVVLDVPGIWTTAVGITDSGIVVGTTRPDGGNDLDRPYRWRDGRVEVLPRQAADVRVVDVNERGQVLGSVPRPDELNIVDPFVWQPDGSLVQVAPDAGSTWTSVHGITDDGVVVGVLDGTRLVTWREGVLTDLEVPGHRVWLPQWMPSVADDGTIVGNVSRDDGDRAYVWRDGVPSELPAPAGAAVYAGLIGDHGDVTGWIDGRAVLWSGGRVRDLDPKGRYGLEPTAVNRNGTVVGSARVFHLQGPVRSDARGVVTPLPGLGGRQEHVSDLHDLEIAVGAVSEPGRGVYRQPVIWVLTVPVRLGTQVDGRVVRGGSARHVNQRGQVLGTVSVEPTATDFRSTLVALWDLRGGR